MWKSIAAVFVGAGLGALLRWWLGIKLNTLFPGIPPGTLAANLLGAYIIAAAIAFFGSSTLPPEWRLLIVTGFCGGLTTFSTFSADLVDLLREQELTWACGSIAVHVCGSAAMTALGIVSVSLLKS